MLVYNFTKGISASINSASASANYNIIETNGTTASQSISNVLFTAIGTKFSTSTYNSGTFGTYLMIGSGDTAVTTSDTNLSTPLNEADFTRTAATKTFSTDGKIVLQTTFNWSGAETEIKEIGLMVNWNAHYALLAREVLDSPITVNNGDTFTVSMVIG